MSTIILLSCTKSKLDHPAPAQELYSASPMFNKTLEYGKSLKPDKMFILSAKHHLVPHNKTLAPYDLTLKDMPSDKRKEWADIVLKQIKEKGYSLDKDKFIFLAGNAYRQYLVPEMKHTEVPFEGLRIGQQKKALLQKLKETIIKITLKLIKEAKKLYKNGL